jgi:hypothetical protein
MQPAPAAETAAPRWQRCGEAVRDPRELLALLGLEGRVPGLSGGRRALRCATRLRAHAPRRPADPLLRQVLLDDELRPRPASAWMRSATPGQEGPG